MIFESIINSVLVMAILMSVGFFLKKINIITEEVEKAFTFMLMNVCLPALVVKSFFIESSDVSVKVGIWVFVISVVFNVLLAIINEIVFKKIRDIEAKKVLVYSATLSNCGFMGFPIIAQVFGYEGIFYASMFYIPVVVSIWTFGLTRFTSKAEGNSIKDMLFNPNMIGIYLGLIVLIFSLKLPVFLDKSMTILGSMTTALAMFIIGGKITQIKISDFISDKYIYYSCFMRLIFAPFILIIFLSFTNMDIVPATVCIIYGGLPSATLVVILAKQYRSNILLASKIVVISHVLSLITLPILVKISTLIL